MSKNILMLVLVFGGLVAASARAAGAGADTFATRGCIGCHGTAGKAPIAPNYPVIGGRAAEFISAELIRFRSGQRQEPVMNGMAAALSDGEIANLAAYLATQ